MLVAIETHPIQYHAPVFRALQQEHGVPVTAIYGSDFSVTGYTDAEFGSHFSWDTDLLSGYSSVFLSRVSRDGAASVEHVSSAGLASALEHANPDAVLVGGYRPHFHRAGFFHAWRHGYPILFRAETSDQEPAPGPRRWARRKALAAFYSRCDRLLYIGARSREHFERLGCPPEKMAFAPYCVDSSPFEPSETDRARLRAATRQSLGVDDDTTVLLFSGKLIEKKRPDLLLDAAWDLRQRGSRLSVVFLGDGALRAPLEARARQMTGLPVVFTGFRNQHELSPVFHAADLFVLPSQHSETWGLVVNEALCHGVPCVVSRAVGSGSDLVKEDETGAICETGSRESLAGAIERAQRLTRTAPVRERCRTLASEYSVAKAAAGIAASYREVTGD